MKRSWLLVSLFLTLGAIILVQTIASLNTRFEYKSKAKEPTEILWNKKDLANYHTLSLVQISPASFDYPEISSYSAWFLTETVFDIRDPDYRVNFFDSWQKQLIENNIKGFVLEDLDSCPPLASNLACPAWWELSLKDFVAQVRQFFSNQTILFRVNSPLDAKKLVLYEHYLLQLDGVVVSSKLAPEWKNQISQTIPKKILNRKIMLIAP